jgi:hypothetical protein
MLLKPHSGGLAPETHHNYKSVFPALEKVARPALRVGGLGRARTGDRLGMLVRLTTFGSFLLRGAPIGYPSGQRVLWRSTGELATDQDEGVRVTW